jgi:hypothetical protein
VNYDAPVTIAVTPAPAGLFNIFAVCADYELQSGRSYRMEPVVAILLLEDASHGQRITHVCFATRDRHAAGMLRSVFDYFDYVGTLTQAEIDAGEADRLVAQQAELDAMADPDSDLAL